MPVVGDDDREIDVREPWSLQTEVQQGRTLELLDAYKEEMEEEFPSGYTLSPLASGRVLIDAHGDEEPLVAYLHDPKDPDAWLVIDDFTPEIWEEWWPTQPKVEPRKAKNLSAL